MLGIKERVKNGIEDPDSVLASYNDLPPKLRKWLGRPETKARYRAARKGRNKTNGKADQDPTS